MGIQNYCAYNARRQGLGTESKRDMPVVEFKSIPPAHLEAAMKGLDDLRAKNGRVVVRNSSGAAIASFEIEGQAVDSLEVTQEINDPWGGGR